MILLILYDLCIYILDFNYFTENYKKLWKLYNCTYYASLCM